MDRSPLAAEEPHEGPKLQVGAALISRHRLLALSVLAAILFAVGFPLLAMVAGDKTQTHAWRTELEAWPWPPEVVRTSSTEYGGLTASGATVAFALHGLVADPQAGLKTLGRVA